MISKIQLHCHHFHWIVIDDIGASANTNGNFTYNALFADVSMTHSYQLSPTMVSGLVRIGGFAIVALVQDDANSIGCY